MKLDEMDDDELLKYASFHKAFDPVDKLIIDELAKRLGDKCRLIENKVVSIKRD